ncbi:MAG: HIRAN domain-containing protein [Nitriliruptoraceae bacterium]
MAAAGPPEDRRTGAARRFRTPVRGHAFAGPAPEEALAVGRVVELLREPANPADPLAIAVWSEDGEGRRWRLGYLDRTVAAGLAPRLDDGTPITAVLDGWIGEPDGRWERPLVRLEVPTSGTTTTGSDTVRAAIWGRPPGVRRRRIPPQAP